MIPDHLHYLALLAGCLIITLPLEFVLGARVWRNPKRLVLSLIPMLIIFVTWDVYGIIRGHWWYNDRFISGIAIGTMPLEELLFFFVIPICGLLTYEAVGRVVAWLRGLRRTSKGGNRA